VCSDIRSRPVEVLWPSLSVCARRLTDQEGQKLQQIVCRGSTSSVRYRRARILLASAGGNRVPVIAQLVAADEDTVRDVIHRFKGHPLGRASPPRRTASDPQAEDCMTTCSPSPLGSWKLAR
jgi:hypothetical protein